MPRVLVIGSANVDYVVSVDHLPAPGETVSGGTLLVNPGGKGANQAVAACRLGAEVRFIGCVGDDASGRTLLDALEREGVGTAGVVTRRGVASGTALIAVDAVGTNQIAVAPGANHQLMPEDVIRPDEIGWAEVVVCQLETRPETVLAALQHARGHGVITVLNPAPVRPVLDQSWPLVDYLTPNAGEAARFGGHAAGGPTGAADAGRALLTRGVGRVIVTLAEHGALLCERSRTLHVPAVRVRAVDTTGAGDAFTGALATALAERQPIDDALRFANGAAALACTKPGALSSMPFRAEVTALLAAAP